MLLDHDSNKSSQITLLPVERIHFTCLTSLNSPAAVFSASTVGSSFMGTVLPSTTSSTWATKPLLILKK
ncbi:hypothetical protein HYC85_023486 [Camellia sinensis]|uniref:Uncharacterized protein n=1 Tax=Camellia sinensis TaxID=4442 RepID=A0A7J7GFG8_CAMSI|nr:hypothetical protein HYC85_023486 [Camellia sinensis]